MNMKNSLVRFQGYATENNLKFGRRAVVLVSAFTLIELLVVIAIIGILATLVITQVAGAQVRARNSSAQSDIAEMGKTVETWRTNTGGDYVVVKNANTTAGSIPASNVNATTLTSWPFTGTEAAGTSGTYGTSINKTPTSSYTYGYETDAAGSHYCAGTNSVNASTVTGTKGFIINDGSSLVAASNTPNYGGASHAPVLPCS